MPAYRFMRQQAHLFLRDFAALEKQLQRQVACPAERLVIELGLTPRKVRELRRRTGYYCPWFQRVYEAMQRHRLLYPRKITWEGWLERYRNRRALAVAKARRPKQARRLPKPRVSSGLRIPRSRK